MRECGGVFLGGEGLVRRSPQACAIVTLFGLAWRDESWYFASAAIGRLSVKNISQRQASLFAVRVLSSITGARDRSCDHVSSGSEKQQ